MRPRWWWIPQSPSPARNLAYVMSDMVLANSSPVVVVQIDNLGQSVNPASNTSYDRVCRHAKQITIINPRSRQLRNRNHGQQRTWGQGLSVARALPRRRPTASSVCPVIEKLGYLERTEGDGGVIVSVSTPKLKMDEKGKGL